MTEELQVELVPEERLVASMRHDVIELELVRIEDASCLATTVGGHERPGEPSPTHDRDAALQEPPREARLQPHPAGVVAPTRR